MRVLLDMSSHIYECPSSWLKSTDEDDKQSKFAKHSPDLRQDFSACRTGVWKCACKYISTVRAVLCTGLKATQLGTLLTGHCARCTLHWALFTSHCITLCKMHPTILTLQANLTCDPYLFLTTWPLRDIHHKLITFNLIHTQLDACYLTSHNIWLRWKWLLFIACHHFNLGLG